MGSYSEIAIEGPAARRHALVGATLALLLASCAGQKTPPAMTPSAPAPLAGPVPPPVPAGIALNRKQEIANALISLNSGEVGTARIGIQQMLTERPDDPVAKDLLLQIDSDPKILLGERSYSYTIRRHETLSSIAGRRLGDPNRFWALAKYNGIAVPASASAGRVIQIPGVAPVAKVREPKPERAVAVRPSAAPVAATPAPTAAVPRVDVAGAARLRRAGLDEMARGSIDKAVPLLERALALNPGDATIASDLARARKVQAAVRQN